MIIIDDRGVNDREGEKSCIIANLPVQTQRSVSLNKTYLPNSAAAPS
jgi:hypothetical protein